MNDNDFVVKVWAEINDLFLIPFAKCDNWNGNTVMEFAKLCVKKARQEERKICRNEFFVGPKIIYGNSLEKQTRIMWLQGKRRDFTQEIKELKSKND